MFKYEYEKRPSSANSCDSRAGMAEWGRSYPKTTRIEPNMDRARRPLPPRPIVCERMPAKTTVPLKVWIIASVSCFAVCAALVLGTVVITKWGAGERYSTREVYAEAPEPIYSNPYPKAETKEIETDIEETKIEDVNNDIQVQVLEKLFRNVASNRENINLISKPQIHPMFDITHHVERKIEKKDQAKLPDFSKDLNTEEINKIDIFESQDKIPPFKPTLPDLNKDIKLPEFRAKDFEDYYNDDNLYDDYMQSNTMTSYLIEKVQELHDWITSDPDFETANSAKPKTEFRQLLKALNESLVEGNVTIIMNKLKDIYFGDNYTSSNSTRRMVLSNSTDMLSFGILTLDVMLLHNIQLMAWESQETARIKMLRDPDVFAFNALFLDPSKIEAKQNEVQNGYDGSVLKRQGLRRDNLDDYDFGKSLLENVLEVGMSTARAAIHLGRAYKNTRNIISQLSHKETLNTNIQNQISRHIDGNTHALNHLQSSFNDSAANMNGAYTELDCVWLLYCRNLVATAKLNPPYGTMARINGVALRMLAGELSTDKALDTMLYEVLTGWTELKCNDMFPRCSKTNAAAIVMDSILQPVRKSQTSRGR